MSDEQHMSDMPEPTPSPSPMSGMGDLSSGAGMLTLGAIVLIATYVIFGLISNDYWVGWMAVVPAVLVVLLQWNDGSFAERIASKSTLMKALGYVIVIVGALALIEDIRFPEGTLDEMPDLLGALAAYAGYVLAFLGARSIKA